MIQFLKHLTVGLALTLTSLLLIAIIASILWGAGAILYTKLQPEVWEEWRDDPPSSSLPDRRPPLSSYEKLPDGRPGKLEDAPWFKKSKK